MLRNLLFYTEEDVPEESRAQIRRILMRDWDPIGIDGISQAEDEYDSYIPKLYHLLIANRPLLEIEEYLFDTVDKRMGMSPPATLEHMRPAAEALMRLELGD